MLSRSRIVAMLLLCAAAATAGAQVSGDFTYVPSQDGFTDEDRSFIYTMAQDPGERGATLGWKCMDDGLNVVYLYGKYLAGDSDDEVLVRYRIDSEPAYGPSYWGMLQGNQGTYMPMHEIQAFTHSARFGETVLFEVVDPLDGERLVDSFSLRGLTSALQRLSCNR